MSLCVGYGCSCLSSLGLNNTSFNSPVPVKDQLWIPKEEDRVIELIKLLCLTLLARGQALVPEVGSTSEVQALAREEGLS